MLCKVFFFSCPLELTNLFELAALARTVTESRTEETGHVTNWFWDTTKASIFSGSTRFQRTLYTIDWHFSSIFKVHQSESGFPHSTNSITKVKSFQLKALRTKTGTVHVSGISLLQQVCKVLTKSVGTTFNDQTLKSKKYKKKSRHP